jgi:hypothetical protein
VVGACRRGAAPDGVRPGCGGVRPGLHRRSGPGQRAGDRLRPGCGSRPAARDDLRRDRHRRQGRPTGCRAPRCRQSGQPTAAVRRAPAFAGHRGAYQRGAERVGGGADLLRAAAPRVVGVRAAAGRSLGRKHRRQPAARRAAFGGHPPTASPAAGLLRLRPGLAGRCRTRCPAPRRRRTAGRAVPWPRPGHALQPGGERGNGRGGRFWRKHRGSVMAQLRDERRRRCRGRAGRTRFWPSAAGHGTGRRDR